MTSKSPALRVLVRDASRAARRRPGGGRRPYQGQPADPDRADDPGREGDRLRSSRPPRRQAGSQVLAGAGRGAPRRTARRPGRARAGRDRRARRDCGAAPGRPGHAREPAVQRGGDEQGRRAARLVRRPARRAGRPVRRGRLRLGAQEARQRLRRRPAPAARGRLPGLGRSGRAQPADRGHPAAVRRGARRREGRGQVRRDRQPDHHGRPDPHRRGHGLPLPRRARRQGRHLPARGQPDRYRRRLPGSGGPGPDRAPVRRHRGRRTQRRHTARGGGRGCDPGRPDGPGHRPGIGGTVRGQDRRSQDSLLERPDGRIRTGTVRRGHPGRRPGHNRQRRVHGGRRR